MSFLIARRPSLPVPLSDEQPGPSILLNPEDGCVPLYPVSPASSRPEPSSPTVETASTHSRSSVASGSQRPPLSTTSTKVSFAPLPTVPPELKRRSSITLGVAARKQLLSSPGGGRRPTADGGRTGLMLTDAEWEDYKSRFKGKEPEVVDLGDVAKSSAKSLWRRVRSGSQSTTDPPPPLTPIDTGRIHSSPRRGLRTMRRNTAPTLTGSPPPGAPGSRLHAVKEERGKTAGLHSTPRSPPPGLDPARGDRSHYSAWSRHDLIQDRAEDGEVKEEDEKLLSEVDKLIIAEASRTRQKDQAILGFDKNTLDRSLNLGSRLGM